MIQTARVFIVLWFLALVLAWSVPAAAQETTSGDHVTVRWLAPDTFAAGKTESIGFYFEVDAKWHVYWRNAGDSGASPTFKIKAEGAATSAIQWPFPTRLTVEHLTNLGYEGNVAYLLPVTPEANATDVSLTVDMEWLVCKIDCIPGFGQMTLSRPVGKEASWQINDLALRDTFLRRVPGSSDGSPWSATGLIALGDNELKLTLNSANGPEESPDVFPLNGDLLAAAKPVVEKNDTSINYRFNLMPGAKAAATDFVVSDGEQAWRLSDVPVQAETALPSMSEPPQPLWLLILAAFVGGMILNLMPCVFPVLSIKLLGLVQSQASHRLREALFYTAGVLATFTALGSLLLLLRASGSAIGWGFQLQSAPVILSLIALFWVVALSFSGVFEFGYRLMTLAGKQSGGAFVTGMLAVFVATPCTGPFMGVALGAAAVLPAIPALAIFLGLGAGLAAPFVLLCLSPALLRRLPKPGAWMQTLQQFLAFPLYLTVIWLLWVLGRLIGDSGWLIGSLLMVALVFTIWLGRSQVSLRRWIAAGIAVVALGVAFASLNTVPKTSQQVAATSNWQAFDQARIEQAIANRQAVFVDYTAAWCITCQVNKKLVLDTDEVQALFKQQDVLLVRADWTHHDAAITQSLARFGRNSVPVYAWYPAGSNSAELLPQLLQTSMIRNLFDDAKR